MAINQASIGHKLSRPQVKPLSDVEPAGLFVDFTQITGDATGGTIQLSVNAPEGLVMRLEFMAAVFHATANAPAISCELDVQWIEDIVGGVGFADRILVPLRGASDAFAITTPYGPDPSGNDLIGLRKVPLGDLRLVHFNSIIALWLVSINTDTVVHEFKTVFSYWDRDAMTRPGFWDAFYETPAPRVLAT